MRKRLAISRETIRALTGPEFRSIVGGDGRIKTMQCSSIVDCPTYTCPLPTDDGCAPPPSWVCGP